MSVTPANGPSNAQHVSQERLSFERKTRQSAIVDVLAEVVEQPAVPVVTPEPVEQIPLVTAERSVVGAMLANNALYDVARMVIGRDDFEDRNARATFCAIADILDGKVDGVQVADPVSVAMRPGLPTGLGMAQLQALALDPPVEKTVLTRARLIHEAAAQRRLEVAVGQAKTIAGREGSAREKAGEIARLIDGSAPNGAGRLRGLGAFAAEAVADLAEYARRGLAITGVPTGFQDLDMLTAGLHPGQLIIIAARPAVGKTSLALSIALHAAHEGTHVLMVSLEMAGKELAKRAVSMESGVDASKVRVGALNEAEWEAVIAASRGLENVPFELSDLPSMDIDTLRAHARQLRRKGRLDLLVVDYIQIMKGNGKVGREQQIAEISRGLKTLSMELEIPVIALSQLNREVEKRVNKRPMLSDLRESGSLEQDADVVIFVHREEVFNPDTPDKGIAELIVAKQRAGSTGDIRVRFDGLTTAFRELETEPETVTAPVAPIKGSAARPTPVATMLVPDPLSDDELIPVMPRREDPEYRRYAANEKPPF